MTLVLEIITDALRQSNLIALGDSPSLAQQVEALRYLNRIVKSVFGNEAGELLESFPVGNKDISRPQGYPYTEEQIVNEWFVPINKRLMLNINKPTSIYLTPNPCDGSRMGIVDVAGNLATNNFTIVANGRKIDGNSTLVLNTNNLKAEWFYRDDIGEWVRTTSLESASTFPFPEEFDDMFITMLAIRLNPAYGRSIDAQSKVVLDRSRNQFRARYVNTISVGSDLGIIRLSRMASDRDLWVSDFNPESLFNTGAIW